MKEELLMMIAKGWTKKYTKREVEIMLVGNSTYTPLEKDKLQYYFNCYNECDEVVGHYEGINAWHDFTPEEKELIANIHKKQSNS